MIVSIIICFLISFILRRGSVRIPYRNNEQSLLQINNPLPRRNLKIMDRWVQKYNLYNLGLQGVKVLNFTGILDQMMKIVLFVVMSSRLRWKLLNYLNAHIFIIKNVLSAGFWSTRFALYVKKTIQYLLNLSLIQFKFL